MAWLLLVLAGLFEIGWAIGLKYTEGGIVLLGEPANLGRLVSLGLIVAGIDGLKLSSAA